jgi:hypothetical protein
VRQSTRGTLLGMPIRLAPVALVALVACSDPALPVMDAAPDAPMQDAPTEADGSIVCAGCNPIAQTGCGPGERCAVNWETESPVSCVRFLCVPEVAAPPRGECTIVPEIGSDDCPGGSLCYPAGEPGAQCYEMCWSFGGDSCSTGHCLPLGEEIRLFEYGGICMPASPAEPAPGAAG